MNTDAPLLRIEGLRLTYHSDGVGVPAVRGVDLVVRRGEIVGVAGESGCGKSTLASTILRLQPASARVEGTVEFEGVDVLTMRWGELRAMRWAGASIVFQGALHSLNPVQRAGAQIVEAISVHEPGIDQAALDVRVAGLLEEVGLSPALATAYPHQLSGGQRQRVMIAMALACRPSLIVADEPTTALDVMVQAQVLEVLTGLVRDRGVGMLIISHDLSVLANLCDRIAVMYAGRIVEVGPGDAIFASPLHPYAAALAGAFPRIGDQASRFAPAGLAGDPPQPEALPPGCTFAPRCPRVVSECHQVDPQLEDHPGHRKAACIRVGGGVR